MSEATLAANDVLTQLTKTPKQVSVLKREALGLISLPNKMEKALDAAIADSNGRLNELRALEARVRMMCDEVGSLYRGVSKNCDLEPSTQKIVGAEGNAINLATGLHRNP